MLKHEANVAFLHGEVVDALPIDEDVAGGWDFEACNQPQHRGLAAAARAEQSQQFTFVHHERNIADRRSGTEFFGEPADFYFHRLTALLLLRRSFPLWPWRSPAP